MKVKRDTMMNQLKSGFKLQNPDLLAKPKIKKSMTLVAMLPSNSSKTESAIALVKKAEDLPPIPQKAPLFKRGLRLLLNPEQAPR